MHTRVFEHLHMPSNCSGAVSNFTLRSGSKIDLRQLTPAVAEVYALSVVRWGCVVAGVSARNRARQRQRRACLGSTALRHWL